MIVFLRLLPRYIRWILYWRVGILILAAVATAASVAFFPGVTERVLRYTGVSYLLIGTGYGFRALHQLRTLFDLPPIRERVRSWWAQRPRKPVTIQVGGQAIAMAGAKASLSIWRGMAATLSLEMRVAALVQNVEQLKIEAETANTEHRGAAQKLRADLDAVRSNLETRVEVVSKIVRAAHTSDLDWAMAAIVFLFVGTILTAIASDIGVSGEPVSQFVPLAGSNSTAAQSVVDPERPVRNGRYWAVQSARGESYPRLDPVRYGQRQQMTAVRS